MMQMQLQLPNLRSLILSITIANSIVIYRDNRNWKRAPISTKINQMLKDCKFLKIDIFQFEVRLFVYYINNN